MQQNDALRTKCFSLEKKLQVLIEFVLKQEKSLAEHRSFFFDVLSEVFRTIDDHEPEIIDYILETYPEIEAFDRLAVVQSNPLSMYASYLDLNRPTAYSD